jgi:hypothetical protein
LHDVRFRITDSLFSKLVAHRVESLYVLQHIWHHADEMAGGKGTRREEPADQQAQTGKKREVIWPGSTVQLTETGVASQIPAVLHLMVPVHTTVAPIPSGRDG